MPLTVFWFRASVAVGGQKLAHGFTVAANGSVAEQALCGLSADGCADMRLIRPRTYCLTCMVRSGLAAEVTAPATLPAPQTFATTQNGSAPAARLAAAHVRTQAAIALALQRGPAVGRVVRPGKTCRACGREAHIGERALLDPRDLAVLQCRPCLQAGV